MNWMYFSMGMKPSPSIFKHIMDTILNKFKDFCLILIDDILVISNKDLDDHFKKVEWIHDRCFKHGVVFE